MAITLAVPGNYAAWYTYNNNNLNLLDNIEVEDLLDVQITSPQSGDVLLWDSSLSKWINVDFYATTSTTTTSTTSTTTTSTTSTTTTSTTSTSTTSTSTTSTTGTTVTFTGSTTTSTSTTSTTSTSTTSTSTTSTSTTSTSTTSTTSTTGSTITTTTTADWSVLDLSPSLWLDASDSETITLDVSDNVSQWDDKSGNDRHVSQSSSSRRPPLQSDELNGLDVVRFNASTLALTRTSGLTGLLQNVSGAAIFAVRKYNAVQTGPSSTCRISRGTGTQVRLNLEAGRTSGRNMVGGRRRDADSFVVLAASSEMSTAWQIHCGIVDYQNTDLFLYMDGSLIASDTSFQTSGDSSNTAPQLLSVGTGDPAANTADQNTMDGDIAEIIVLNSVPSTEDRQRVEGYLANKWGLGKSLPEDHPYAPTTTTTTTV